MKKIFFAIMCMVPSFICASEHSTNIKISPRKSRGNSYSPVKNRIDFDADPMENKSITRVRSQSSENKTFVAEENVNKLFSYYTGSEGKK